MSSGSHAGWMGWPSTANYSSPNGDQGRSALNPPAHYIVPENSKIPSPSTPYLIYLHTIQIYTCFFAYFLGLCWDFDLVC